MDKQRGLCYGIAYPSNTIHEAFYLHYSNLKFMKTVVGFIVYLFVLFF